MATFACKENCGGIVAEEGMTCAPCLSKDEVAAEREKTEMHVAVFVWVAVVLPMLGLFVYMLIK
jgi:hypothetical protein